MTKKEINIFYKKWRKYLIDLELDSMKGSNEEYTSLYEDSLEYSIFKLKNPKEQKLYINNQYLNTNQKLIDLNHILFKLINEERYEECVVIKKLIDDLDITPNFN